MNSDHVYGVALLSNAMHQSGYAPGMARHPRLRVLVLADDPGAGAAGGTAQPGTGR